LQSEQFNGTKEALYNTYGSGLNRTGFFCLKLEGEANKDSCGPSTTEPFLSDFNLDIRRSSSSPIVQKIHNY
jgi:hypothetical protein